MAKVTMAPQPEAGAVGTDIPAGSGAPAAAPQAAPVESGAPVSSTPAQPDLSAFAALLEEKLNKFQREQQGLRAKQEERIKQTVTSMLHQLTQAGITPTPEQRAALETQVRDQVSIEDGPETRPPAQGTPAPTTPPQSGATPTQPTQTQPESPATNAAPNPQTALAWSIMDAYQVDIEADDPEAKLIDYSDPNKIMVSTTQAILAKQQRMARGGLPLTGGAGNANPIANINDPAELLRGAFAKK